MILAKVVLNDIGTLANSASARQALNDNFQKIEDEFKKVVYRDGSTPNSMEADLDMDSHRVMNVADAVHDKDAVNKGQVADIAYEAAEVVWQPRFDALVNEVEDELSRTLKLPSGYTNMSLPAPEPSRLIGWNANGTALRNNDLSGPADLLLRSDLADNAGGAKLVAHPIGGTIDKAIAWISPEMSPYNVTGVPGNEDDTEAFQWCAERSPFILLTPGKQYKIGDWDIPSGTTIMSFRGMGHFSSIPGGPPIVRRRNGSGVNCLFDTRGRREIHLRGFHIKGASADGYIWDAHLIRVGGYIIHLENLDLYEGLTGLGGQSGDIGQNTQIISCRFGNCITGITRIVDTTMTGGSITGCKSNGLLLSAGNNFNTIRTRIEFNGNGGGTYPDGHNVSINAAEDNILDLTNDRAYLSGVRALAAKNTIIRGVFRRNGAKDSEFEGRSHIYMKNCENVTVDIVTTKGKDDDGGGANTPRYAIHLDNSDLGNKNITIQGDLSGNTIAPILETNGTCRSLTLLATGAARANILGGRNIRGGQSFADYYQTGNLAPSATASGTLVIPDVWEPLSSQAYTLRVFGRDAASNAHQWYAEFPVVIGQGLDNTALNVTVGAIANEIAYSDGPNYITVNGAGKINVDIGSPSSSGGHISIPITVENNSPTYTHKVKVELV